MEFILWFLVLTCYIHFCLQKNYFQFRLNCNYEVDRFTRLREKVVRTALGRPVPLQKYGRLFS